MSDPVTLGVLLLVCSGLALVAWLVFAWWDVGRRGEKSGTISKVGMALLEANVGRRRKQQMNALIVLTVALVVILLIAMLVLRSGQHSWSQWGA